MTTPKESPVPRPIPACPWCGSGTAIEVRGNGLGQLAMTCTQCGSSGPSVGIDGDFDVADERAVTLWAGRRQQRRVAPELLHRIGMAVRLHCLASQLSPDSTIGIAWSDLDVLLRTVAPQPAGPVPDGLSKA